MRGHKLHALGVALLVVSGVGALPLVTSSSFSDQTVNNANLITAVPDWVPPTVPTAVISKTAGTASFIRANGPYRIYANAADTGAPASGIATVRADVGTVTTGQTSVALVAGSYTANGVSYGYRSAQLTARAGLPTGALAFSVTATDNAGGATTASFSVTGDNTAPSASAVQAANVGGTIVGRAELGDTLTLTYSEVMDGNSILAGWNGTTNTNVILVLVNGGTASDYIQVYSPAQTAMPLGTVTLNRTDFIAGATGAYVTFGLTGTPSTMTGSGAAITFVLGTPSGAVTTAAAAAAMTWTPSATATDRAGNASTTTVRTESGTSDRDF